MPRTTMRPGSPSGSPPGRRMTSNVVSQQPIRSRSTRLDRRHNRLASIRRQLFSEPRSPVGVNEIFFPEYDSRNGGRKRRRRSRKKGRKSRKSRRRNKRKSRKKRSRKFLGNFSIDTVLLFSPFSKSISIFLERKKVM